MVEDRIKLAVFIDFDNIQIGVKDTLGKEFDVSLVLEALKERGEVVTKVAYGDWPRAGEHSRQMTQHAVHMVQRNVTPRGDKNGADINLALDALEMAFTRNHINAFAIVGGDSDFIALVEKLKQYDKRVFVVGGRSFTSNILQRNCHEFIAYENLLKSPASSEAPRVSRSARASTGRSTTESRSLSAVFPTVQRALKILADREVAPQLGPLKSTVLQLDSTFSERDYGAGSFREFMQKIERAGYVHLRRIDRGYLVEAVEGEADRSAIAPAATPLDGSASAATEDISGALPDAAASVGAPGTAGSLDIEEAAGEDGGNEMTPGAVVEQSGTSAEALNLLKVALAAAAVKSPNRPLYMRHIRQALRVADKDFDERRFGFKGFLDFLHQAQREGWLKLQRDRKGVWRIFQAAPSPSVASEAVATSQHTLDVAIAAGNNSAESLDGGATLGHAAVTENLGGAETARQEMFPESVEEVSAPEASGEAGSVRKTRKPRAARGTGPRGIRKTITRRKPKSSDDE